MGRLPDSNPTNVNSIQILNFLQNLVTRYEYKAISLILHPCCNLNITNAAFTVNGGNFNVVLTISDNISLLGRGTAQISRNGVVISSAGVYDDNGHITFTNIPISAGSASFGAILLFDTNFNNTQGIFIDVAAIVAIP